MGMVGEAMQDLGFGAGRHGPPGSGARYIIGEAAEGVRPRAKCIGADRSQDLGW